MTRGEALDGWLIFACLVGGLAVSCLSGFRLRSVPAAAAYPFTPLGLALGCDPDCLKYSGPCRFAANWSWSLDYFKRFAQTIALETPFYLFALRALPWSRRLSLLAGANFLTHPLVFFAFPCLFKLYVPALLASEAFAAFGEAALVGVVARRRSAAALAFVANLVSWQLGIYL